LNNVFYCSKGDHIAFRYEILDELGKGAFGRVLKAFDHKEKEEIALKILKAEDQFNE
jgi:dual specificity tyrosine-phosphorylation-regulated kinase 2/3/4